MTEVDIEQIIQRARNKFPGVTSRIISDNGPQFIAKDFIRICNMGARANLALLLPKQRQNRTLSPHHQRRLYRAIGYITPLAKL